MQLHVASTGAGLPVIILHGLFGSGDNWAGVAKKLSNRFRVLLPDLRNHGRSPHSPIMDYPTMAADVLELMDRENLDQAHLIGHSMGGKVAMTAALTAPERISRLVVVDIAPKAYDRHHDHILDAMLKLDPASCRSLSDLESCLAADVPDAQVRRFLLKSVQRTPNGTYQWKLAVEEIAENYDNIAAGVSGANVFTGPTLFTKGELSDYISSGDEPAIKKLFPRAVTSTIPRADHWVHADNPTDFLAVLEQFLDSPK